MYITTVQPGCAVWWKRAPKRGIVPSPECNITPSVFKQFPFRVVRPWASYIRSCQSWVRRHKSWLQSQICFREACEREMNGGATKLLRLDVYAAVRPRRSDSASLFRRSLTTGWSSARQSCSDVQREVPGIPARGDVPRCQSRSENVAAAASVSVSVR